jgi:hypothetical protein
MPKAGGTQETADRPFLAELDRDVVRSDMYVCKKRNMLDSFTYDHHQLAQFTIVWDVLCDISTHRVRVFWRFDCFVLQGFYSQNVMGFSARVLGLCRSFGHRT